MVRVMVLLLMMTMMILMIPGAMAVATISPSGRESPRQEGVSSLGGFHREEVAE